MKVYALQIPGQYDITGPLENAAAGGKGFFGGMSNITLGDIITQVLPLVFAVAGILLFVYFLVAGVQLITSGGDQKAVESAKARLTNAIIGAAVIALAYVIIKFIQATLTIG